MLDLEFEWKQVGCDPGHITKNGAEPALQPALKLYLM